MTDTPRLVHIDFTTLSSQLRVIRTSPAWEAVQPGLDRLSRLDARAPLSPAHQQDGYAVESFARMLRTNYNLIFLALVCGAAVGQAAPGGTLGERLVTGLTAISRALHFRDKDDAEVQNDLNRLAVDIEARLGLQLTRGAGRPVFTVEHLEAYKQDLMAALQVARRWSLDRRKEEVRAKAWRDAGERLNAYFVSSQPPSPEPTPTLEETLTLVAGLSPGVLLPVGLSEATILQWSGLIARAFRESSPSERDFAPPWLAAVGMHALGFSFPSLADVETWLSREVTGRRAASIASSEVVRLWGWLQHPAAERAVLIVCESINSLIAEWKPSPRTAALALTAEQFMAFAERGLFRRPPLPAAPGFHVLAVEEPEPGADTQSAWSKLVIDKRVDPKSEVADERAFAPESPPRVVRFLPEQPVSQIEGAVVIGPQSVEDLFPIGIGPQLPR